MHANPLTAKAKEAGAFLAIGGVAFLVDAGVYNGLVFLGPEWHGILHAFPLPAKIVSIVIASVVTYVGNRYWTYSQRHLPRRFSRYVVFAVCNLIAIGLQMGCLAFSRYVLHLDDPIADNVSGTLIGQALATVFRFVSYDRWVFPHEEQPARSPA